MDGSFQWFIKTRKILRKVRFYYGSITKYSYVIIEKKNKQMVGIYIKAN